jgi:hypothetical protein
VSLSWLRNIPTVAGIINWPTFSSKVIEARVFSTHAALAELDCISWLALAGNEPGMFEMVSATIAIRTLFIKTEDLDICFWADLAVRLACVTPPVGVDAPRFALALLCVIA